MPLDLRDKKIAVLMGGPGSERQVSLASGAGVVAALRELGALVTAVDVADDSFSVPDGTDIAFNVIHGTFGEDGQVQRVLEARKIPYTGEGVAGSELAIDKLATKRRFLEREIPTAPFEVVPRGSRPTLPLPFVVKAPREGSSVGVYIVREPGEIDPALEQAGAFGPEFLVEQFVEGRELTVGVVGAQALPIIEIRAKKDFYNFENKYPFLNPNAAGADHFCPAPLPAAVTQRVQAVSLAAHRALGLEIYSRVDLLLTAANEPYVLEVNTIPGMTPASLLPEAAAAAGMSYPELCRRIIELSLPRFAR